MFTQFRIAHVTVALVALLASLSSTAVLAKSYQHELGSIEINELLNVLLYWIGRLLSLCLP